MKITKIVKKVITPCLAVLFFGVLTGCNDDGKMDFTLKVFEANTNKEIK